MEVLKELISSLPVFGWLLLIFSLLLCSVPIWEWIEYRQDVKEYGKETADALRIRYR